MNNTSSYVLEVKMPPSVWKSIFKPILWFTAALYGIMTWYNHWMAIPFAIVVCVVIWMMLFFNASNYRYALDAQELRISKVNKKKAVGKERAILVSSMALLVKSQSERLNPYIFKGEKLNMRDYTSRNNPQREYVLVSQEQGTVMMSMLELDGAMLDAFRAVIPQKVYID